MWKDKALINLEDVWKISNSGSPSVGVAVHTITGFTCYFSMNYEVLLIQ